MIQPQVDFCCFRLVAINIALTHCYKLVSFLNLIFAVFGRRLILSIHSFINLDVFKQRRRRVWRFKGLHTSLSSAAVYGPQPQTLYEKFSLDFYVLRGPYWAAQREWQVKSGNGTDTAFHRTYFLSSKIFKFSLKWQHGLPLKSSTPITP